ncbi:MAG: hypothetical protein H6985_12895 [Pseudomonadales bacterium]|nr:hypothetical protein [Halioglobus sp.]MCP5130469.1 hypothetical protein [Pseudomonadales bacterium]
MKGDSLGIISRALLAVGLVLLGPGTSLHADDTEIYQTTYNEGATGRPKVLIVIDDSGSMDTTVPGQRPAYDPSASYDKKHESDRVYWVENSGSATLPDVRTSQYFDANVNRCAESYQSLAQKGFFDTNARRWIDARSKEECTSSCPDDFPYEKKGKCYKSKRDSGGRDDWVSPTKQCETVVTEGNWATLNADNHSPRHVECQFDVTNGNPSNGPGVSNGYPMDNVLNDEALGADTPAESDVNWSGSSYRFYSGHYMDYLYDNSTLKDLTRMEIAQIVIGSLIKANKGIDFGLLEFNGNWSNTNSHGGRIVQAIITSANESERDQIRTNMVNMLDTMTASGSTPLCEATYEAYRYLAGKTVYFGDDDDGWRDGDILDRDTSAESPPGTYKSPASDCAYTYVVIMTDGLPQNDDEATSAIESLTGKTCGQYLYQGGGNNTKKNCLPELAEYMANTDLDNDTTNGNQYGITYTIGFTTNQVLLSEAAKKGKGQYFTADSADELTAAFQGAILSILSTDSTFTSPAVAVDTFSRTQSRDDIFYAMFKPNERVDWRGNIKKLKIRIADGSAALVDANGHEAIDAQSGFIKDTATTFWSPAGDGATVEAGGVGGLLAARDPGTRSIYSNTGVSGALEVFESASFDPEAFDFQDNEQMYTFFGVSGQAQLDVLLAWARGYDVYDEDDDDVTSETRPWVLADILHSQPLVVNYGALGSFTREEPDLRLIVGTNGGFVHMFGNDNGAEDWAFFPKELAPVLRQRSYNAVSSQHVYGVDSTPLLYSKDVGKDGTIDASDGDKAYVYLGLRRGGDALYALDISNPDSPSFMWMIDSATAGFEELGQTWSRPVVTRIPGYVDGDGVAKPVLIMGAGYDTNKDASGVATEDSEGRGIFIIDAETGELVWSITPADDSATNLEESGLLHSVAAEVAVLDSNGDEITDRIYFGDTGGNLWRVDLPGNSLPTSSQDTWRIVQLGDFNGGTAATDRRFFNAPDIVRTSYGGFSYDAISIGSGDRTNPNATDNEDQYYMIRDQQVSPYFTEQPSVSECLDEDGPEDFRCNMPLYPSDLYDVTPNLLQYGTDAEKEAASSALAAKYGWRMDLSHSGEKSLAKSLTIDGKAYLTTFSPDSTLTNLCEPSPGTGRLYVVRLGDAAAVMDFNNDNTKERSWVIGSLIPDTPSPHFGADGVIRLLLPPGSSAGLGNPFDTGATFRDPFGNYWYREEY